MPKKKVHKPRKTDIVTRRLLHALEWATVSEIIGEPGKSSDRKLNIQIAENIIITHCKSSSSDARWVIEIDGIAQLREDYVRLDFAQPECLEMTGRSMREIIDHPAFEGIIIDKVAETPWANRRSGVVFKLQSEKSGLEAEQWAIDETMKIAATINPEYARITRLRTTPTAIKVLEGFGVDFDDFQAAYQKAGTDPYPNKVTESLDLRRQNIPMGIKNLCPRVSHGLMRFHDLPIASIGQESIMFDALEDYSRITIPYKEDLPLTMIVGLAGRDLADVIGGWRYGRGSIITEARIIEDKMILKICEDPVTLPEGNGFTVNPEEPYEGALNFADGITFESLDQLVKKTHQIEVGKPSPEWSDHLDVKAISIREKSGQTIALKMRQKGLKKQFAKRYGFTVVGDGWWICPLKQLTYEAWGDIILYTDTIGISGQILLNRGRESLYNLRIESRFRN